MASKKQIAVALAAGIPLAVIGWYLFRPELLFVNATVSESAPVSTASKTETLATGSFASYAHETTGTANLLKVDGKTILRLEGFKTSNGPDVHVYLVKGKDASQSGVNRDGFIDLGVIKGNVGDQNYEVPSDVSIDSIGGVAIWCKRFSVDFGGATLQSVATKASPSKAVSFSTPAAEGFGWHLAGLGKPITVTFGDFKFASGRAKAKAATIEEYGKRFLRITPGQSLSGAGLRVLLVKAEDAKTQKDVAGATKLDLGSLASGKKAQDFLFNDSVDLWLYRTAALWDARTQRLIAVAPLRSAQEKKPSVFAI